MQYTPLQLKEKLVEGIDNENNVVDMPKVLQVVCILERYPVTREILEETRIGRLVNDIRRKTNDKQLAKRAKELVRSWQKVINGVSEVPTTVNGEGVAAVAANQPRPQNKTAVSLAASVIKSASATNYQRSVTPNTVKSSLSPGQFHGKPSTPSLQNASQKHSAQFAAKRSISSPHLCAPSAKRLCTPPSIGSQPGTPDSFSSQGSRASSNTGIHEQVSAQSSHSSVVHSNKLKRTHSSDTLLAHQHQGGDIRAVQSASCLSPAMGEDSNSGLNGVVIKANGGTETPTHSIESKGLKTTIRFNRTSPPVPVNGVLETPKVKRGRGRPPKNRPQVTVDQSQISPPNSSSKTPANGSSRVTPPNGSTSKSFSERKNARLGIQTEMDTPSRAVSLTPKVKSTAELIQSLQAKNSLSVGKETAQRIQSNMIYKEEDVVTSVLPDGVKPRPHQKKGSKDIIPPSTPVSLKTKTEMVQKFLESSVQRSSPDDLSPLKYEMPRTESPGNASTSFEDSVEGNHESTSNNNLMEDYDQRRSKSVIPKRLQDSFPKPGSSTDNTDKTERPLSLEEIYSRYPRLDFDNFVIDDGEYEMPESREVNQEDIGRLHETEWAGVNGCHDAWGSWTDWARPMSLESYKGDHLHILPYVNTDD